MAARKQKRLPRPPRALRRQAMWEAIRRCQGRDFTDRDIAGDADTDRDVTRYYLGCLVLAGILERLPSGAQFTADRFRLLEDRGHEAPRFNRRGEAVTKGRAGENLWRAAKMLREFTSRDLALHAATDDCPVKESYAIDYCSKLARAGYLLVARKGGGGLGALYRVVPARCIGAQAPRIQRDALYDPHLERIVLRGGKPVP